MKFLILLIVPFGLLGCISASSSAGGEAGASAKAKQQSEQDTSIDDTSDIDIQPTIIEIPIAALTGKTPPAPLLSMGATTTLSYQGDVMRVVTSGLRIKSGTKTSYKSEDSQDASADAVAKAQADADASARLSMWLMIALIVLIGFEVFKFAKKKGWIK